MRMLALVLDGSLRRAGSRSSAVPLLFLACLVSVAAAAAARRRSRSRGRQPAQPRTPPPPAPPTAAPHRPAPGQRRGRRRPRRRSACRSIRARSSSRRTTPAAASATTSSAPPASFVELVTYYRTVLKQKGELVFDAPADARVRRRQVPRRDDGVSAERDDQGLPVGRLAGLSEPEAGRRSRRASRPSFRSCRSPER